MSRIEVSGSILGLGGFRGLCSELKGSGSLMV